MKRSVTPVFLALSILLAAGCAPPQELEDTRTELAVCREENARLERDVARWQERYDRAGKRWDQLQASVDEAVPNALAEIDAERERVLELVPEQVQYEVSTLIDEYFDTVMQGFAVMRRDSEGIKLQLEATQKALAAVGKDTRAINAAIEQAVADAQVRLDEERGRVDQERGRRQDVAGGLAALVQHLVAFDRDKLSCKDCPDRIRLSRKEREAILAFHAQLLSELATLQEQAGP